MIPRLRRARARALRDTRGVALIEFALVAPVLVLMLISGVALTDALGCNRKVTTTARAVADLTSQYSSVSTTTLDTILAASTQVMSPYPASAATVRVSQIQTDNTGRAKVAWSRAVNGSPLTPGSAFTMPTDIAGFPNMSVIYSETIYAYTPVAGTNLIRPLRFAQTVFMMPRTSTSVSCSDCPTS